MSKGKLSFEPLKLLPKVFGIFPNLDLGKGYVKGLSSFFMYVYDCMFIHSNLRVIGNSKLFIIAR